MNNYLQSYLSLFKNTELYKDSSSDLSIRWKKIWGKEWIEVITDIVSATETENLYTIVFSTNKWNLYEEIKVKDISSILINTNDSTWGNNSRKKIWSWNKRRYLTLRNIWWNMSIISNPFKQFMGKNVEVNAYWDISLIDSWKKEPLHINILFTIKNLGKLII